MPTEPTEEQSEINEVFSFVDGQCKRNYDLMTIYRDANGDQIGEPFILSGIHFENLTDDQCCLMSETQPDLQAACQTSVTNEDTYYEYDHVWEKCKKYSPQTTQSVTSTGEPVGEPQRSATREIVDRDECCLADPNNFDSIRSACIVGPTEYVGDPLLYFDEFNQWCGVFNRAR